ncbi:GntR family transcriptional regulator [Actinopolymorpha pittospori]|uniref:DNA-binding GntR family transcriptional regulator n=1 Tax=Actinopolymorpha pittospori TaxID=648752 RepID=A0A927MX29_9ACTN|nr:DNA-binding GntR family transcriptional regulator [Actinopolymorpha pittospori]
MRSDLEDPRPRYVQVADDLRDAIRRGDYEVGDRLPPTREISELYGISHMTVKQALAVLRYEGVITSRQGVGVFVRAVPAPQVEPTQAKLEELSSRVDELEARVHRLESHEVESTPGRQKRP